MIDLGELDGGFQVACLFLAVGMLLWDTVEVGRNDAANIINAVFGARLLTRRVAIMLAAIAVVGGAVLSSDVIDTARKGIFDPTGLNSLNAALAIYVSVYIVDTALLYGYSAFGMPVSTTACLVFELFGAAAAIQIATVNWTKAGVVAGAIVCSIIMSGLLAFLIQRAVRGAIRNGTTQLSTLLLHGGWVGGALTAGLCYFLLLKGMKNVQWVSRFRNWMSELDATSGVGLSSFILLMLLWGGFAICIHILLVLFRRRAARLLFPVLAVLGMLAMAFSFGQNDLANCASPGLATISLLQAQSLEIGTRVPIPRWMLLICGLLLVVGMATRNAARVTKAAVSTGSMGDRVALWAPRWCIELATKILPLRGAQPALVQRLQLTPAGKTVHHDALRASVITSVSASVIATASSFGLPVSTTYVSFAAVVATGMADRVFQRGDAELKLGRTIWVVTSWFLAAIIAAVTAGVVATIIFHAGLLGIAACLAVNLSMRLVLKRRADRHEQRVRDATLERIDPSAFALEDEHV